MWEVAVVATAVATGATAVAMVATADARVGSPVEMVEQSEMVEQKEGSVVVRAERLVAAKTVLERASGERSLVVDQRPCKQQTIERQRYQILPTAHEH